eukprot:6198513-Pleurochrysis_carterae.AAC.1
MAMPHSVAAPPGACRGLPAPLLPMRAQIRSVGAWFQQFESRQPDRQPARIMPCLHPVRTVCTFTCQCEDECA